MKEPRVAGSAPMIRFGPAGIPLSCKGRTARDGVIYTRNLELDAMEVQFVRGIRMTEEEAQKVGEVAREANIEIHCKAPYYINLAGDDQNVEMSISKILAAGKLGHEMGAETVVFHPGFYGELSKEETMTRMVKNIRNIRNVFVSEGWKPRLGIEVMGKRNVFGSLDEVVEVCSRVKGLVPVVDFAHIHARGNGILQEPEDFKMVFDRLDSLRLDHYLIHFTGVLYENGNARYRLPIKKGDLKFEPLCEVLLENNYDCTILSTSPILEHDAMYMNIVFDRVKDRRDARIAREIREAEEAAEKAKREEERRLEAEQRRQEKEEEKARLKAEKEAEKARLAAEKAAAEAAKKGPGDKPEVIQSDDSGRRQVQVDDYKLYRQGNRFVFMKQKKDGYSVVFKVPDDKVVEYSHQGVPLLRDPPHLRTPKVIQSDDTGRRQVQVDDWKLYRKDNAMRFMREKKDGYSLVFKVPDTHEVAYMKSGQPTIRVKQE